jgi:uncharacterized protein YjiS (DUF1127 family)
MTSIEHGQPGRIRNRSVRRAISHFLAALGDEARIRRDIVRLEAMSDRDLADIGLSRGGIRAGVRRGRAT